MKRTTERILSVRILAVLLCLALLTGLCFASLAEGQPENGDWRKLIAREEYAEALPLVQEAADGGDPDAMAELAYMLVFGLGVEKDAAKGYELAAKALETEGGAQNGLAMYLAGYHHYAGKISERDYSAAMEWFKKAAEQGNGEAMARIGALYMGGYGVEKNVDTAFEWYRKATENNGPTAWCLMGSAYENGRGVEKDFNMALEDYRKAYTEGNQYVRRVAAGDIAILYMNKKWEQNDESKAEEWAEKAAEEGDPDVWYAMGRAALDTEKEDRYEKARAYYERGLASGSLLVLYGQGEMYENGRGAEIDYARAKALYEQAAAAGCADANTGLSGLYLFGYGVEQDNDTAIAYAEQVLESEDSGFKADAMIYIATAYEKKKDYEKSLEWMKRAAVDLNSSAAYGNVGRTYYYGIGVKKDYGEAVFWYEKAAETGDTSGLAQCYFYGNGKEKDYGKAMELYLQGLDSGVIKLGTNANPGIWYIATMYRDGLGVEQDHAAALEWYEKGAEDKDPDCMIQAARLYRDGKGTEKNLDKAMELYQRAALQDSASAYGELGDLYCNGKEVEKDYEKAAAWYEKGGELGSAYCYGRLGWIYAYGMKGSEDYEKAYGYFQKGAELDYPYGYERLGVLTEEGKGTQADPEKAAEYYRTAVELSVEQDNETILKRSMKGLNRLGKVAKKITPSEKQVTLLVGSSVPSGAQETRLTCTVSPETAFWQDVYWASLDDDIATVDENGTVRAVSPGKAVIWGISTQPADRPGARISVTVNQAVESLVPETPEITVAVKKKAALKMTVGPKDAQNKKLEWSSADEEIATVGRNGQVSGKAPGTTTVTATAADGSGVSAAVRVTVVQPVTKITAQEKTLTLAEKESSQVHYEVLPETATDKTVLWTSGNEAVATVDESGVITAVGAGRCTITGTAADGSKAKVQIKVTVK